MTGNLLRKNNHFGSNIKVKLQYGIAQQKNLGDIHSPNSRVVEGALKPLVGIGCGKIRGQTHQFAGKTGHPFTAHGVALVGHGRTANLTTGKGFFLHLEIGEQPQVHREFVGRRADAGQGFGNLHIKFPGVGLACDIKNIVKSKLFGDKFIKFTNFVMIAIEQLEKGRLGANRSLGAAGLELFLQMFDVVKIHQQILNIKSMALADRGGLGRLIMSVAEGGQCLVGAAEGDQVGNDIKQGLLDQAESAALKDEIGVAADKLRGGAEMNDRLSGRALTTIGIDMSHDIMTDFFFLLGGDIEVDVSLKALQLVDHWSGHEGESQFVLGLGQGDPAAAPGGKFCLF